MVSARMGVENDDSCFADDRRLKESNLRTYKRTSGC